MIDLLHLSSKSLPMKYITTLICFCICFFSLAQSGYHIKSYDHFEGTRGNSDTELILTLPSAEIVQLQNHLNTTSGFGWTFNYFGNVLVVEQLDILADGTKQLLLRKENGKDFFGSRPFIKAVLKTLDEKSSIAQNTVN